MACLRGTDLTREKFLLREMGVACRLREEGLADDELIARIVEGNLFQYRTDRMLRSIARACVKRMNAVDSPAIIHIIATGLHDAAAQADLYALMSANPLVRDFMTGEVARHFATFDYQLGPVEMGAYLTRLQTSYDNIAHLSDSTIAKIKSELRHCLVECGMLENQRSRELRPAVLDPEVRAAIEAIGDVQALSAFGELVSTGAAPEPIAAPGQMEGAPL